MSSNLFEEQPEFVDTDPRRQRTTKISYTVDHGFMQRRHEALFPEDMLKGRSVLDLGASNAASGAWVLSHGASHYTAVELQPDYVKQSTENLERYYPKDQWRVVNTGIEEFLAQQKGSYDVVIALGVVHAFANVTQFLRKIAALATYIALDGSHPETLVRSQYLSVQLRKQLAATKDYVNFIENESFISYQRSGMSLSSQKTVVYDAYVPSMGFLVSFLEKMGFTAHREVNETLKKTLPAVYSPYGRFGIAFSASENRKEAATGFRQTLASGKPHKVIDWSS